MPSAAPSPVGPYSVPLHKLAQMLSECSSFQTRAGLTYPDAAAEAKLVNGDGGQKRIFYPMLETSFDGIDPYAHVPLAIITWGDDWQLPRVAGGARNYFHSPRGELILELIDEDQYTNLEAATREFGNWVGLVLHSGDEAAPGLAELAALNDRLAINGFQQLDKPQQYERVSEAALAKRLWSVRISIRFGLEG